AAPAAAGRRARRRWNRRRRGCRGPVASHAQRCGRFRRVCQARIAVEAGRPAPAAGASPVKYEVLLDGKTRIVELAREDGAWKITLDGNRLNAHAVEVAPNTFSVLLDGRSHQVRIAPRPDGSLTLHTGAGEIRAEVADPRAWRGRRHG